MAYGTNPLQPQQQDPMAALMTHIQGMQPNRAAAPAMGGNPFAAMMQPQPVNRAPMMAGRAQIAPTPAPAPVATGGTAASATGGLVPTPAPYNPTTRTADLIRFLQGHPSWQQWIGQGIQGANQVGLFNPHKLNELYQVQGGSAAIPEIALGTPAIWQGLATLNQLLGQQGHVDPRAGNQVVAGIQRNTQTGQQNTQGELARRGLSGSGIGQALAAAQGQAGQNQINQYRAGEAQQAEERKRQDLQLLYQMVMGPAQDAGNSHLNFITGNAANRTQQQAAQNAQNAQYAMMIMKLMAGGA